MSENGRLIIPVASRRAANLKPGEALTVRVDDEGIHIQTRAQAIKRAQAVVRKYVSADRSLSEELIAERRLEAKREAMLG
ncbi:MAG: AbrB/MazE/SpoVT family DNA-binding domain-containing protein [Acidobacteriaceae bacterium]